MLHDYHYDQRRDRVRILALSRAQNLFHSICFLHYCVISSPENNTNHCQQKFFWRNVFLCCFGNSRLVARIGTISTQNAWSIANNVSLEGPARINIYIQTIYVYIYRKRTTDERRTRRCKWSYIAGQTRRIGKKHTGTCD